METCPECGESVVGQKFCPQCGTKLVEADSAAATDVPAEVPFATAPLAAAPLADAAPAATEAPAAISDATKALFAAVAPQRYIAAALRGLAVYAATWVLGVIVTLLLFIELASGGETQLNWGWLFFAPGQLVGLSLGGVASASASLFGASASVSLLVLPLLLTAAVIVGTVIVSRRDERLSPTPSRGSRWLLSVTTGVALAIVAVLVAAIFPLSTNLGGGGTGIAALISVQISLSTASVTLFLGAVIVGTITSYLARARVATRRTDSVVVVGPLRGSIRSTFPALVLYLVVAGVLVAVAALITVIVNGGASTLWSALLWLPTVVANGLAFINLGTLTAGGSATSLPGVTAFPTNLWMPTSFPAWVTILVIVVNLVLIVLIGTVLRLRRATVQSSAAMTWGTTVISFAAAGAVLSLISSVALWTHLDTASLGGLLDGALGSNSTTSGLSGVGGSGSSALDAYASLSLTVGPAAWTFLIFAVLGALVEVSAVYLAPLLLPLVPAATLAGAARFLARVGAPLAPATASDTAGNPLASPAPMTPERKRRARIIFGSIGGAVVIVVLAIVAISILGSTVFGPQRQVQSYLSSLVAKDASQAVAIGDITVSKDSGVLLTNAVAKATQRGVSGYSIANTQTSGDSAVVTARVDQNGSTSTETFSLHRDGSTWLFLPVWKMTAVPLSQLTVQVSAGISSLNINGATVHVSSAQASAGSLQLAAFPGEYTVALGGKSQWLTADSKSVVIDGSNLGSSNGVAMTLKPTAAFRDAVKQQVQTFLNGCVAQNVLAPTGCPFEEFGFGDESAVVWKITSVPSLSLSQSDDGTWNVSSAEEGHATVNYNEDFFGVTAESDDTDFDISGTVKFVGGKPVFTDQPDF